MYNHNLIEKKWQKIWKLQQVFKFSDTNNPKYYVLDMFPYPSGSGLHVGHPKGYTATDIIARFKQLNGFDVLHPIGWDAFGLPAEQYALQTGHHPKAFTQSNIVHFREQLAKLGFTYDPSKEVDTTDPNYYRWTQWIFSQLFKKGLAEIKDVEVNWCEQLATVLSNEEVLTVNGKMVSERGEHPVIKKPMRQWVLKITDYADKLLDGLDKVDWPESLKSIQRNWIGKSVGALVKFKATNKVSFEVFTTRVDTLYGVTYLAIAPESKLVSKLTDSKQKKTVNEYVKQTKSKTELQRKELDKTKSGVFLGAYAINPLTKKKIPIYVADYVLDSYGTGIVMGVPGHDQRDYDFAKKHDLPIVYVITNQINDAAYDGDGIHINSPLINNLDITQSKKVMLAYLTKHKIGVEHITYKLKDWLFSRQRYWGEPFPILLDGKKQPHLITELPVLLPQTDKIKSSKTGESPLANLKDWVNVTIKGKHFKRDTNTMPQWAGSCWYYLGYLLKQTDGSYLDLDSDAAKKIFERWLPVDMYIGGQEHAVLHLLYARFWHHFLYDIGVVPTEEPFQRIINQGMILGSNGEKMSKSKGNVINPDEIIESHGADALRLYESFMGPLTASLPWTSKGLNGIRKWLDRVCRLFNNEEIKIVNEPSQIDPNLNIAYHKFIKQVSNEIEHLNFNVAISQMMIYINVCYNYNTLLVAHLEGFLIVLSCFAPHLSEELWHEILQCEGFVSKQKWPAYEEKFTVDNRITLPVQINGKLRSTIMINRGVDEKVVVNLALNNSKIMDIIKEQPIKKTIYIKDKILNFIV